VLLPQLSLRLIQWYPLTLVELLHATPDGR